MGPAGPRPAAATRLQPAASLLTGAGADAGLKPQEEEFGTPHGGRRRTQLGADAVAPALPTPEQYRAMSVDEGRAYLLLLNRAMEDAVSAEARDLLMSHLEAITGQVGD